MVRRQARLPLFLGGATLLYLFLRLFSGESSNRQTIKGWRASKGHNGWDVSNKTIVIATMTQYDTSWVHEQLPDWQPAIYVVDDHQAPLHTKVNKGHEANVYLTWIIDNYENLPEITAFLHHHEKSWHIDNMFVSNPDSVQRLNLETVRKVGYQSLSCGYDYVCRIDRFTRYWSHFDDNMAEAWPFLFPGVEVPNILLGPCCAQFAVTKDTILNRPKADYIRMRRWVEETEMSDFFSGRVFEYTWHFIFGKPAYFCNGKGECACDAFDVCDLNAHMKSIGSNKDPAAEKKMQEENWEKHKEWEKAQREATEGRLYEQYQKDSKSIKEREESFRRIFEDAKKRAERAGYTQVQAEKDVEWRDFTFNG